MKNYTTQTAALKATTIDTRLLDAKQINTEKLFINGELFDPSTINGGTSEPSQIKESPNEAKFLMIVGKDTDFLLMSLKTNQDGDSMFSMAGVLQKGSQTNVLPNGVYAVIEINDDFIKCFSGYSLNDVDEAALYNISLAKFGIVILTDTNNVRLEQCILENFYTSNAAHQLIWAIKICEEDDDLSELYESTMPGFEFLISIPYYIPENDTSSTYSLRKTNPIDSLCEKFEEMRQQMLDKSAE